MDAHRGEGLETRFVLNALTTVEAAQKERNMIELKEIDLIIVFRCAVYARLKQSVLDLV
jgi:hypothetical protein